VPMGGAQALAQVIYRLDWRDTVNLARCNKPLNALACALIGVEAAPVRCTPNQLTALAASKVTRKVRCIELDCSDIGTLKSESINILRTVPLLRHLCFLSLSLPDSQLLVELTRKPAPPLLQSIRIEGYQNCDPSAMWACRALPALHTLSLSNCTVHNGNESLNTLSECVHLEKLELSVQLGGQFEAEAWLALGRIKCLRKLHLDGLMSSGSKGGWNRMWKPILSSTSQLQIESAAAPRT
jgi:hypothetical protein